MHSDICTTIDCNDRTLIRERPFPYSQNRSEEICIGRIETARFKQLRSYSVSPIFLILVFIVSIDD